MNMLVALVVGPLTWLVTLVALVAAVAAQALPEAGVHVPSDARNPVLRALSAVSRYWIAIALGAVMLTVLRLGAV